MLSRDIAAIAILFCRIRFFRLHFLGRVMHSCKAR